MKVIFLALALIVLASYTSYLVFELLDISRKQRMLNAILEIIEEMVEESEKDGQEG